MVITTTSASLLRLLQLSSVSLPVGGFSFSQGLETAIDQGWVRDLAATQQWLTLQLYHSIARIDLPVLRGAMAALAQNDTAQWQAWNDIALANRETKELRFTDTAMGDALKRLLKTLDVNVPPTEIGETSFVTLFAVAAHAWQINVELAAQGFVWSWLENQVAAATKLVPLGQTQAQRLLADLQNDIPVAVDCSASLDEFTLGGSLPALAIASSLHETQYSRLFRS